MYVIIVETLSIGFPLLVQELYSLAKYVLDKVEEEKTLKDEVPAQQVRVNEMFIIVGYSTAAP